MEKRLITQRQKIINALKESGSEGMTNAELSKISLRYGGHIGNLYSQGYKLQKFNLDGGLYKYVLISEPSNIKFFKNAQLDILEEVQEKYNDAISSDDLKDLLDEKYYHVVRRNGWYLQEDFTQENC